MATAAAAAPQGPPPSAPQVNNDDERRFLRTATRIVLAGTSPSRPSAPAAAAGCSTPTLNPLLPGEDGLLIEEVMEAVVLLRRCGRGLLWSRPGCALLLMKLLAVALRRAESAQVDSRGRTEFSVLADAILWSWIKIAIKAARLPPSQAPQQQLVARTALAIVRSGAFQCLGRLAAAPPPLKTLADQSAHDDLLSTACALARRLAGGIIAPGELSAALAESQLLEHAARRALACTPESLSIRENLGGNLGDSLLNATSFLFEHTPTVRALYERGLPGTCLQFLLAAAAIKVLCEYDGGSTYGLPAEVLEACRCMDMHYTDVLPAWVCSLASAAGPPPSCIFSPAALHVLRMRTCAVCTGFAACELPLAPPSPEHTVGGGSGGGSGGGGGGGGGSGCGSGDGSGGGSGDGSGGDSGDGSGGGSGDGSGGGSGDGSGGDGSGSRGSGGGGRGSGDSGDGSSGGDGSGDGSGGSGCASRGIGIGSGGDVEPRPPEGAVAANPNPAQDQRFADISVSHRGWWCGFALQALHSALDGTVRDLQRCQTSPRAAAGSAVVSAAAVGTPAAVLAADLTSPPTTLSGVTPMPLPLPPLTRPALQLQAEAGATTTAATLTAVAATITTTVVDAADAASPSASPTTAFPATGTARIGAAGADVIRGPGGRGPAAATAMVEEEGSGAEGVMLAVRRRGWWEATVRVLHVVAELVPGLDLSSTVMDDAQTLVSGLVLGQGQLAEELPACLPAEPPPDVAAALAAGLVPALEHLLRRTFSLKPGQDTISNAPRAELDLLASLLSWPQMGWLMAYGNQREVAALVVTLEKIMHALGWKVTERRTLGKDAWPDVFVLSVRIVQNGLAWVDGARQRWQQLSYHRRYTAPYGAEGGDGESSGGRGGRGTLAGSASGGGSSGGDGGSHASGGRTGGSGSSGGSGGNGRGCNAGISAGGGDCQQAWEVDPPAGQLLRLLTFAFQAWLPLWTNGAATSVYVRVTQSNTQSSMPHRGSPPPPPLLQPTHLVRDTLRMVGVALDQLDLLATAEGSLEQSRRRGGGGSGSGGSGGSGHGTARQRMDDPAVAVAAADWVRLLTEEANVPELLCRVANDVFQRCMPVSVLEPLRRVCYQMLTHCGPAMGAVLRSGVGAIIGDLGSVPKPVQTFNLVFGPKASKPDKQLMTLLRGARDTVASTAAAASTSRSPPPPAAPPPQAPLPTAPPLPPLAEVRSLLRTCGNTACRNLYGSSETDLELRPYDIGSTEGSWLCGLPKCREAMTERSV